MLVIFRRARPLLGIHTNTIMMTIDNWVSFSLVLDVLIVLVVITALHALIVLTVGGAVEDVAVVAVEETEDVAAVVDHQVCERKTRLFNENPFQCWKGIFFKLFKHKRQITEHRMIVKIENDLLI